MSENKHEQTAAVGIFTVREKGYTCGCGVPALLGFVDVAGTSYFCRACAEKLELTDECYLL